MYVASERKTVMTVIKTEVGSDTLQPALLMTADVQAIVSLETQNRYTGFVDPTVPIDVLLPFQIVLYRKSD